MKKFVKDGSELLALQLVYEISKQNSHEPEKISALN